MSLGLWLSVAMLGAAVAPEHGAFQAQLERFVEDGRVDYAAWKAEAAQLSAYVDALEQRDPAALERADAMAYWINLYNAATIELVLAHHPVASIRDIESPWQREVVVVAGRALSLDAIENEILRPTFADARMHFALNCAARSCPRLQEFAFRGEELEEQLERVTRAALADPRVVDASECSGEGGTLRLNRIFEWYAEDFGDVRAFLGGYADAQPVVAGCAIEYLEYDWALND